MKQKILIPLLPVFLILALIFGLKLVQSAPSTSNIVPVNDETQFCREACGLGKGKPSGNFFGFDSVNECLTNCLSAKGIGNIAGSCNPDSADGCCNVFASQCQDPDCRTAEVCDGKDNDCDGVADFISQSCYTGSPATRGVGECSDGTQICSTGTWGTCTGQVVPATESCDSKDNDCDGATDENLGQTICGTGVCQRTVQSCVNGVSQTCTPGSPVTTNPNEASEGLCNGLDDNCDGQVDEGCSCVPPATRTCGSSVGECREGTESCTSFGTWGICTGGIGPSPEVCDGKDNDCDGVADFISQSCYTGSPATRGVGECSDGTQICSTGTWGTCTGQVVPATESCDSKDNDCDGEIDESFNFSSDNNNCGACGISCNVAQGFQCCSSQCIQSSGDLNNCGGCGIICSSNNILPSCTIGQCNGPCDPGWVDCNSDKRSDGCETDTLSDPFNCGGCGIVCFPGICRNSVCQ